MIGLNPVARFVGDTRVVGWNRDEWNAFIALVNEHVGVDYTSLVQQVEKNRDDETLRGTATIELDPNVDSRLRRLRVSHPMSVVLGSADGFKLPLQDKRWELGFRATQCPFEVIALAFGPEGAPRNVALRHFDQSPVLTRG